MTEQDLLDFGFKYVGEDTDVKAGTGKYEAAHLQLYRLDRPERYDCIFLSIFPYQFETNRVERMERNSIEVETRALISAYREAANFSFSDMYNIKVYNISDLALAIELLS